MKPSGHLGGVVLVQCCPQGMCRAISHLIHQCPELGGMVMVDGVAEFVKNHVVLQMLWHLHQIEREADGVSA